MKKTKIICTMGPACEDDRVLEDMLRAGMNVARFNFSHGTHEEQRGRMERVKRVREKLGLPVPLLLDTKGPEYRIGTFRDGGATLEDGSEITFTADSIQGDAHAVSVSYPGIVDELEPGEKILINNGLLICEVEDKKDGALVCRVVSGGKLTDHKSLSFPGHVLKQTYLSEADRDDLLFGIEMDVDFIACSFVSCARDLQDVRDFIDAHGGKNIDLIAKIENRAGVDNIEEIIEVSDGIMVARGDMGVEIPYEELPAIQKKLVNTCRFRGKRVIVATEMLESMIEKPRPTRAEISDVAGAVYDGTSAIMLSGETAVGKYPAEAVAAMSRIAERTEGEINYVKRFRDSDFQIKNVIDAVSHATCALAIDTDAALIVVCSRSGRTARMVSRFRSPKPIIGMTTDVKAWRKLALSWSVIPAMADEFQSTDVLFYHAKAAAKASGLVKTGDRIVITGGTHTGMSSSTNLINVETI